MEYFRHFRAGAFFSAAKLKNTGRRVEASERRSSMNRNNNNNNESYGINNGLAPSSFSFGSIIGSHRAHLLLCVVGGVMSFLPLLTRTPRRVNYDFHYAALPLSATDSSMVITYLDSCIMALMLLVPIAVDAVLDFMFAGRSKEITADLKMHNVARISKYERGLLVVGLAVAPITGLLPASLDDLTLIYMCSIKCQFILVVGVIMTSLSRYNGQHWNGPGTTACLLGHIVSQIMALYYVNGVAAGDGSLNIMDPLLVASVMIQVATVVLFLALSARWVYATLLKASVVPAPRVEAFAGANKAAGSAPASVRTRPNVAANKNGRGHPGTVEHGVIASFVKLGIVNSVLFTLLSLTVFVGVMASLLVYTFNPAGSAVTYVGINLAVVAIELLLLLYLLRKSKMDMLQALYAVKEAKKVFVRFISHELRTPLNTAFLGLNILIEDLKAVVDPQPADKDRLETCEDVNKAVLYAVEILNGILTFDKIEAGLMGLNATDVPVRPLVTDCVAAFEKEADRAGVRLALVVPTDEMPPFEELEKMYPHVPSVREGGGFSIRMAGNRSVRSGNRSVVHSKHSDGDDNKSQRSVGKSAGDAIKKNMSVVSNMLMRGAAAQSSAISSVGGDRRRALDPNTSPFLQDDEVAIDEADLVRADAMKVRRVIHNLLSNGIKFARTSHGHVTVRVTFVPDPNQPGAANDDNDANEENEEAVDGEDEEGKSRRQSPRSSLTRAVRAMMKASPSGSARDVGRRNAMSHSPSQSRRDPGNFSPKPSSRVGPSLKERGLTRYGSGPAGITAGSASLNRASNVASNPGSNPSSRPVSKHGSNPASRAASSHQRANSQDNIVSRTSQAAAGTPVVSQRAGGGDESRGQNKTERAGASTGTSKKLNAVMTSLRNLQKRGESPLPSKFESVAPKEHVIRGKLRIVVTDDGVGLSEANQQRLFTEIVTFNPEILQAGGGSGFGLYISKSIVDLHKGTIAVASKGEGKGCAFTVELPMTRSRAKSGKAGGGGSIETAGGSPRSAPTAPTGGPANQRSGQSGPAPRSVRVGGAGASSSREPAAGHSSQRSSRSPRPVSGKSTSRGRSGRSGQPLSQSGRSEGRDNSVPPLPGDDDLDSPPLATGKGPGAWSAHKRDVNGTPLALAISGLGAVSEESKTSQSPRRGSQCTGGAVLGSGGEGAWSPRLSPMDRGPVEIVVSAALGGADMVGGAAVGLQLSPRHPFHDGDGALDTRPAEAIRSAEALAEATVDGGSGTNVGTGSFTGSVGAGALVGTQLSAIAEAEVSSVCSPPQNEDDTRRAAVRAALEGRRRSAVAKAAPRPSPSPSPSPTAGVGPKAGIGGGGDLYHVLVVDDSHLTRKMLTKTLRARKHTCEEAEDGDVAVRMVEDKLKSGAPFYDAILMDYVMPGMSGPDATEAIRALGVTCPIIGVTGNTLDMDVKRFLDMGANEVFGKPFDMGRFTAVMVELRGSGGKH